MRGWEGIGRMPKHRVRRVDLGDLIRYRPTGTVGTVRGIWLDGHMFALIELETGPVWVPTQDCDVLGGQP
jgi:hypothetical protein